MKLAVIIPDRGDRPEFLSNCLRMMQSQTLKPDHIELVNDKPLSDKCDITYRYRIGYDRCRKKGFDIIALIENDDWYHTDYLKFMTSKWIEKGTPDLLGTNFTIYYHIKLRAWFKMNHARRSSAMNTLIRPDLNFKWCPDHEAYTDLYLWQNLKGAIIDPINTYSIGIKHGTGLCGGRGHNDRFDKYMNKDGDLSFLKSTMNEESFKFYSSYGQ